MPNIYGEKNAPQDRGVIKMYGKEINTDIKSKEVAKELVTFLSGLAPQIKSAADKDGVSVTFGGYMWYVPHNYDPNIPQAEALGKSTMVQCKTIEEAGFLCIAKWNQANPDKKFAVPDTLTKVAEKFIPALKSANKKLLTARPVLKSFAALKNMKKPSSKIRSSSDDASASYTPNEGDHSPKGTTRHFNKQ